MDQTALIEAAKARFDFDAWPRLVGVEAARRTTGFVLDLRSSFTGWAMERRIAHGDRGYADYFQEVPEPEHRVMVRVTEHASHDAALLALLELLSGSMVVSLPRLDDLLIGDVTFCGHDEQVNALFFVRHNVLIDTRSIGDAPVSVLPFARLVDQQIVAASA